MSTIIQQDLQAFGMAPVVVVLPEPAAGSTAAARASELSRYFVSSELGQESAILLEANARPVDAEQPMSGRGPREVEAALRAAREFRGRPAVRRTAVPEVEPPPLLRYYPHLGVAFGTVTREGLAALRQDEQVGDVVGAPQISLIRPTRVRAVPLRARATWGIRRLGIPALWERGLTGEGVLVGHLDTGVDGSHPALRAALHSFAEFDAFGRQIVPAESPHDTGDHGTHTAATIAGRPDGNRHVGVAPGAMLASAIVIEGGQVVPRVLGGMDWAVGQGVKILNMSLGLRGWMEDFRPLTRRLRECGVLPVFAVGNEGPGTSRSPGNYTEALSVGGMDESSFIYEDSSSQRFARPDDPIVPDLVAPGVNVISARPGGGYHSMDGTSMATPHLAGLAALLLEANPDATVGELEQAILNSAKLEPGWSPDRAGRGIPDAQAALAAVVGDQNQ